MSFDSREKSLYDGRPVECYRFVLGSTIYLWTSADASIVLPTGTYTPNVISRGEISQSQEEYSDTIEVTVAHDNPIVAPFMPYVPGAPVLLTIYRAHRGEESLAVPIFIGSIASVVVKNSEAVFTCAPLGEALSRTVPSITFQPLCNWPLYGAGCGVNAALFRDACVLDSVNGVTVKSAAFAAKPDGWYRNGWMEDPNGEVRFIVGHITDTITLISPYAALAAGQTVHVLAGCDRTEATCVSKFNNFNNYMGFVRIPDRNPFSSPVS